MLWFFDGDEGQCEVETRYDNGTSEYVLIVRWPDGHANEQRCPDLDTFRARILALNDDLKSKNWRNTGSPIVLPDGWPDKRRNPQ